MAKKFKDPVDEDFDDDLFGDLDLEDGDLDGFGVDLEDFDSEKDRTPAGKLGIVTNDLSRVGRAAAGGAAAGIAYKVKQQMPEVGNLADSAITIAGEASRLKTDVMKELRPALNQTKIVSRQLLKYTEDVIPKSLQSKLEKLTSGAEEDDTVGVDDKESLRENQIQSELTSLMATQIKVDAEDKKKKAVNDLIDKRVSNSRHMEMAEMVNTIRHQSMFQTAFAKSTLSAYLKKSLELKYRHMYLAIDTLDVLRVTAQMTENKLDAIRHNTSLPDFQKIHLTEMIKQQSMDNLVGGITGAMQNYSQKLVGRIKENIIEPAMEGIGGVNDMLQSALMVLEMDEMTEEMEGGESSSNASKIKNSVLGGVGGLLGGMAGKMGATKLIEKLPPEALQVVRSYSKMGTPGLVMLLEQIRRGEIDTSLGAPLEMLLDTILPEVDRTAGSYANEAYTDPLSAGMITKKFTTTVEEIIPGYLSMQVSLLQELISGAPAERQVFDMESRTFKAQSVYQNELKTKIFGSAEASQAVMKGHADSIREAARYGVSTKAMKSFEESAADITIFMQNLANANRFPLLDLEGIRDVASGASIDDRDFTKIAFRGIKDPSQVASVLMAMLTDSQGSTNFAMKSTIESRITETMVNTSQKFRDAMDKAVNAGNMSNLSDFLTAKDGKMQVNTELRDSWTDQFTSNEALGMDKEYQYDEHGNFIKDKSEWDMANKGARYAATLKRGVKSTAKGSVKLADRGITFLANKAKLGEEYSTFKTNIAKWFKDTCRYLKRKRIKFQKLLRDQKNKVITGAFDWFKKQEGQAFAAVTDLIFDPKGKLIHKWDSYKLATAMITIIKTSSSKLHEKLHLIDIQKILYHIYSNPEDNAVLYVLGSMMPDSLIYIAEMTEEELETIENTINSEKALAEAIDEKANKKSSKKKTKEDDVEVALKDPIKAIAELEEEADLDSKFNQAAVDKSIARHARKMSKRPTISDAMQKISIDTPSVMSTVELGGKTEPTTAAGRRLSSMTATIESLEASANRVTIILPNADGLDIQHGVSGIYDKPTAIVGPNSKPFMVGDGGEKEALIKTSGDDTDFSAIPLNKSNKRNIDILSTTIDKLASDIPPSRRFAEGDESVTGDSLKESGKKLLDDTKTAIIDNAASAKTKVEKLYAKLKTVKPNSFLDVSAAVINFVTAVKDEGVYNQLDRKDKQLVDAIQSCLDNSDYRLNGVGKRMLAKPTIFGELVIAWQKLYDKAHNAKDVVIKQVTNYKDKLVKVSDTVRQSKTGQLIETKARAGFDIAKTKGTDAINKVKELPELLSKAFSSFMENKRGKLVDIASMQLDVLEAIFEQLQTGVVTGERVKTVKAVKEKSGIDKKDRTSMFSKIKGAGKSAAKGVWGYATTPYRAAANLVFNKSGAVYRKPGKNETLNSEDHLLISEDQFREGIYHDAEGKKRIKSIADISGQVWSSDGELLVSKQDVREGLVNSKGDPIRTKAAAIGRAGRGLITGSLGLVGSLASDTKDAIMSTRPVRTLTAIASTPFKAASAMMRPYIDVFVKDRVSDKPLLVGKMIKAGAYVYAESGKPLKSAYDVNKPIMYADDPVNGDMAGNLAVTWEDIQEGLVNSSNKPLDSVGSTLGNLVGKVGRFGLNTVRSVLSGSMSITSALLSGGLSLLSASLKKKNPYVDVYIQDENGNIEPGKPVLQGIKIKERAYAYLDGGMVKSAYGIKGAVMEISTKNTLIKEEDLDKLVDIDNKPLTSFSGKSVAGKILSMGLGAAGFGLKTLGKGALAIGKAIGGGIGGLLGKATDTGASIIDYFTTPVTKILDSIFQDKQIGKEDLETIVGDKLTSIVSILDERLPGKPKRKLGDKDGDGDRDGSYNDYMQQKKERQKSKAGKAAGSSGVKTAMGKAGKDGKDGGGLLDTAGDLANIKQGMSGMKGFLSNAKGTVAKWGSRALGGLGLAKGGALLAGAAGTATAGTAGAAAAGTSAAVAGTAAAGAGAAGLGAAAVAAAPVVLGAAAVAALGYTSYKVWDYFSGRDVRNKWTAARYKFYGHTNSKRDFVIDDMEKDLAEILNKDREPLSDKELEKYASLLGLFSHGFLGLGGDDRKTIDKAMGYFVQWYKLKFAPIFNAYATVVKRYTKEDDYTDLDPKDIDEKSEPTAFREFTAHADRLSKTSPELVPTEEGLKASLAMDSKRPKDSEKSDNLDKVKEDADKNQKAADKKAAEEKETSSKKSDTTKPTGGVKKIDPTQKAKESALLTTGTLPSSEDNGVTGSSPSSSITQPTPVKVPDVKAADIPDGGAGDLGSYVKKFESGNRGSSTIGYDSTGGTSYGTYQIASKVGSMEPFLKMAKLTGGKFGGALHDTMNAIGNFNTYSKDGEAPSAWKAFAATDSGKALQKIETAFIKKKYYDVALNKIQNSSGKALVESDRGLQEALWSTAVQHGASGAASIFDKTYHDGISAEDWLRAIYKERGTRFGSSNARVRQSVQNRFDNELAIVLGLSGSQPPTATEAATAEISATGINDTSEVTDVSKLDESTKRGIQATLNQQIDKNVATDTSNTTIKPTTTTTPAAAEIQTVTSDRTPQVTTDTVSQTGKVGNDVVGTEQLQTLRAIERILTDIKSGLNNHHQNTAKYRTDQNKSSNQTTQVTSPTSPQMSITREDITLAIGDAFRPGSATLAGLVSAISSNQSVPSTASSQPEKVYVSTDNTALDIRKKRYEQT